VKKWFIPVSPPSLDDVSGVWCRDYLRHDRSTPAGRSVVEPPIAFAICYLL